MDTREAEHDREVAQRVGFENERAVKRRLTSKTTEARLLELIGNPESKKLTTGKLAAMMDDCVDADASKDIRARISR